VRAAWYERQGPAGDVLVVGELPDPGEVRIRVRASGVNPGDIKKREGWLGLSMSYPLVIPHSDGAGEIDALGAGIDMSRFGERVWCYGAQSYRPFGTAAEHVVVPEDQAVHLPESVSLSGAQPCCPPSARHPPGVPPKHRSGSTDGSKAGVGRA
jgi:NADPH:quinone reductase